MNKIEKIRNELAKKGFIYSNNDSYEELKEKCQYMKREEKGGNKVQWYASDKADSNIIAYGFYTGSPRCSDRKKGDDFKITYKSGVYICFKKTDKKFKKIGSYKSLLEAQMDCEKHHFNSA